MVRHVLIVEDSLETATIYSDILSDEGYDCEIVELLNRAMARLRDTVKPKVDVMLLDLTLPNGAGIALVRGFNTEFPHVPMGVITGGAISVEEVIEAGAQFVLFKGDFVAKDLVRAVKEAIPRHQVRGLYSPLEKEIEKLREHVAKTVEKLADPNQSSLTSSKDNWEKKN